MWFVFVQAIINVNTTTDAVKTFAYRCLATEHSVRSIITKPKKVGYCMSSQETERNNMGLHAPKVNKNTQQTNIQTSRQTNQCICADSKNTDIPNKEITQRANAEASNQTNQQTRASSATDPVIPTIVVSSDNNYTVVTLQ